MRKHEDFTAWLSEAQLFEVRIHTGFELFFQRSASSGSEPNFCTLRWSNVAEISTQQDLQDLINGIARVESPIDIDRRAMSVFLSFLLGRDVAGVNLSKDGVLSIEFKGGHSVRIIGISDDFDYAGWEAVFYLEYGGNQIGRVLFGPSERVVFESF